MTLTPCSCISQGVSPVVGSRCEKARWTLQMHVVHSVTQAAKRVKQAPTLLSYNGKHQSRQEPHCMCCCVSIHTHTHDDANKHRCTIAASLINHYMGYCQQFTRMMQTERLPDVYRTCKMSVTTIIIQSVCNHSWFTCLIIKPGMSSSQLGSLSMVQTHIKPSDDATNSMSGWHMGST